MSGAIEVGLNGNQAMKTIFREWLLHPKQADYNLLKDLRKKISQSPLTLTGRWVEGHQDDLLRFEEINRWSQLNVECDRLAKAYWNSCTTSNSWIPNRGFANEGWSVWIDRKKLTRIDKHALYDHVFSRRTKAYWSQKNNLMPELITTINWDAYQHALKQLPFGKRRWLLKHTYGILRSWQNGKDPR